MPRNVHGPGCRIERKHSIVGAPSHTDDHPVVDRGREQPAFPAGPGMRDISAAGRPRSADRIASAERGPHGCEVRITSRHDAIVVDVVVYEAPWLDPRFITGT